MTARALRSLIDPNVSPLRSEPRDARDLMIAAHNGWVLAFDNVSHLGQWLSDGLSRLATGGGLATRELYSDTEETIFEAKRPVLLTGIEELTTSPDLLDRALVLHLPRIDDEQRRTEEEMLSGFDDARARVLGILLDAVSKALACVSEVRLLRSPRMADFATWITAGESAFGWPAGTFLAAYDENRAEAHELLDSVDDLPAGLNDLVRG